MGSDAQVESLTRSRFCTECVAKRCHLLQPLVTRRLVFDNFDTDGLVSSKGVHFIPIIWHIATIPVGAQERILFLGNDDSGSESVECFSKDCRG